MSVQGTISVIQHTVDQANSVHINDDNSEAGIIRTEASTHTSTASTKANTHMSTTSLKVKIDSLEFDIEIASSIPALSDCEFSQKKNAFL